MKRKLVGALAAGTMLMSLAGTASADPGGVPDENSCIGDEFSRFAGTDQKVGPQASTLAQNDFGPGISAEVAAFRALQCP